MDLSEDAGLPEPIYIFKKNMAPVSCLYLCQNKEFELLYVGTEEGLVHIWNLKTKREQKTIKVADNACLAITHCNDSIITQEKGYGLKYWRVVNLEWLLLKEVQTDYYGFCKILVFNDLIYCPFDNGSIRVYQGEDTKEVMKCGVDSNRGEVMCMKFLKNCRGLLVAYESGILTMWGFEGENPKIECEREFNDTPMCLDVCDITEEGILGTSGECLKKISVNNGNITEIRSTVLKNPGIGCVSIRQDGKLLVAGCWDGRIRYFSMKHLTLLVVLDHHSVGPIQCVMFSEKCLSSYSAHVLFAAGCDGRISLWDLYARNKLRPK